MKKSQTPILDSVTLIDLTKPILPLNRIHKKYNGLRKFLYVVDKYTFVTSWHGYTSVRTYTLRIASEVYEKDQEIDRQSSIRLDLCRRKKDPKAPLQFIWEINFLSSEYHRYSSSNLKDPDLRTSDETKCLMDIVETYYKIFTQSKLDKALQPKVDKIIKYQDELWRITSIKHISPASRLNEQTPKFDLELFCKNVKRNYIIHIVNSIDWDIYQPEKYIEGEVLCKYCKKLDTTYVMDTRFVRGFGYICGPCRDHLYDAGTIKDGQWDELI